ncbi:hypothetical protein J2W94_002524 [Pseudoxanthomonas sacheonensis]|uniref:Uncharacterized protein n=1 Tax=Pseudoxanthomonas sacheonensis TaxID=443615 RepID=A0ABU1RTZ0_9GAMM|nr:hypothetical protein [Pseudoxanthomonas sacheonensis]
MRIESAASTSAGNACSAATMKLQLTESSSTNSKRGFIPS